jgi:hypothetical protein
MGWKHRLQLRKKQAGALLRRSLKEQQSLYRTRVFGYTIEDDLPARIREAHFLQQELVDRVGYPAIGGVDRLHVAESFDHKPM